MSITVNENLIYDLQAQLRTANETIEYANRVRLEAEEGEKGYADALKQANETIERLRKDVQIANACVIQACTTGELELRATVAQQAATIGDLLSLVREGYEVMPYLTGLSDYAAEMREAWKLKAIAALAKLPKEKTAPPK